MPTINKLPAVDVVQSGDQLPVYSPNLGDARRMSVGTLAEYIEDNVIVPNNAANVTYDPAGTGAVSRTVQSKLRDVVSVKDFGAIGDGVADDTAAIQAAVDYGITIKCKVFFPAGTYLVTDTINLPIGAQLAGETGFQYTRGFSVDPKATTINFQPTTLKSLFVCSGTSHSNFRFHYSIEGFYLRGNSTNASGNSLYALDLDGAIYARYENIGIEQFRTGIHCNRTINNRFCNIYTSGKVQAVLYAGNIETTDVWDQCSFWGSPIGVQTTGSSIAIRFTNCLFEQIDTYGVNLTRETQNFIFENCYSEDVCFGGSATSAMFRVGFDGTAAAGPTQLTVIGGFYAGRNAGAVGAFITAETINGVVASSVDVRRFTTGILTSANTGTNQIVLNSFVAQSLTTIVSDATKVSGIYPRSLFNASEKNAQRAKLDILVCPDLRANTTSTGTITLSCNNVGLGLSGGYVAPNTDNTQPLGLSNLRWSVVYSGTPTINTSDEREKQDIADLDAAEKRVAVAIKGLVKKFRFKDAVQKKGDDARIHVGVIAQEVMGAFQAEGLDPMRYGIVCHDEWEETPEVLDADGEIISRAVPAGDRYGVRYEELLAFIISAL